MNACHIFAPPPVWASCLGSFFLYQSYGSPEIFIRNYLIPILVGSVFFVRKVHLMPIVWIIYFKESKKETQGRDPRKGPKDGIHERDLRKGPINEGTQERDPRKGPKGSKEGTHDPSTFSVPGGAGGGGGDKKNPDFRDEKQLQKVKSQTVTKNSKKKEIACLQTFLFDSTAKRHSNFVIPILTKNQFTDCLVI